MRPVLFIEVVSVWIGGVFFVSHLLVELGIFTIDRLYVMY